MRFLSLRPCAFDAARPSAPPARSSTPSLATRALLTLLAAVLLASLFGVPEAEARKRRHYRHHHAGGGYNPPPASMVFDVNTGRILHANNPDALRHPASVTKVMTLFMLFEQLESGRLTLDGELPVSRAAASQAPSKLGLRPGDTIGVEDAILALVTKSANDVAVVVAEAISGDEAQFAGLMTRKARALGMSRSVFRNASGLPNPEQVTTARDLVTLGKAIQDRFPKYYAYFGRRSFAYEGRVHRNHNNLLGRVDGVDGIKTGYTRASGFNLLTSAKLEGRHIITVVLGGRSARSRDALVASLIEGNMERAYAGRRLTAKTIDVAQRDDEDDAAPALPAPRRSAEAGAPASPVPQLAPAPAPPVALPQPPSRPRTAVIAETGRRAPGDDPGLTRTRPLALAASGSTNIVQSATSPLALVATTPRSPALRWVTGAPPAEPPTRSARSDEPRLVPPASLRYTNTIPAETAAADDTQPLPQDNLAALVAGKAPGAAAKPEAPPKAEERIPPMSARAQIAAATPLVPQAASPRVPGEPAKAAKEPAREASAPKDIPAKEVPAKDVPVARDAAGGRPAAGAAARSGWVIQLAAADSETKARTILDDAIGKARGMLRQAEPFTEPVTKGSATLYRARFAGFDAEEAQSACKALKRSGFSCFAQKI